MKRNKIIKYCKIWERDGEKNFYRHCVFGCLKTEENVYEIGFFEVFVFMECVECDFV